MVSEAGKGGGGGTYAACVDIVAKKLEKGTKLGMDVFSTTTSERPALDDTSCIFAGTYRVIGGGQGHLGSLLSAAGLLASIPCSIESNTIATLSLRIL